nr:MAG TPA: hypothetical protein [Caudoviricetes sp.]
MARIFIYPIYPFTFINSSFQNDNLPSSPYFSFRVY